MNGYSVCLSTTTRSTWTDMTTARNLRSLWQTMSCCKIYTRISDFGNILRQLRYWRATNLFKWNLLAIFLKSASARLVLDDKVKYCLMGQRAPLSAFKSSSGELPLNLIAWVDWGWASARTQQNTNKQTNKHKQQNKTAQSWLESLSWES